VVRLSAEAKVLSRLDLGYSGGGGAGTLRLVPDAGGNLWVRTGGSYDGNRVYRVAPGGGLLGTYTQKTTGYGGAAMGIDKEGYGWITNPDEKKAVRLAPNMTKAAEYDAASEQYGAYELASSGDRVWLAFSKEIAVWKLDGSRDFGIPTGYAVMQMRPAGDGGMWALSTTPGGYSGYGGSVVRFDDKGTATASYAVGPDVRGFGIGGDGSIWAANYETSTVTRVGTR
jgi:streptogramin lyase